METRPKSRWRLCWMVLGWLLILLSPVVGIWPGPGGIFVFAAGAALLIRNSTWAKRRYVQMKKRWPRLGRHADRIMCRGKTTAQAID